MLQLGVVAEVVNAQEILILLKFMDSLAWVASCLCASGSSASPGTRFTRFLIIGLRPARGGLFIASSRSDGNSNESPYKRCWLIKSLLVANCTGKKDHNYKNRGRWTYPGGFQQLWCPTEFE